MNAYLRISIRDMTLSMALLAIGLCHVDTTLAQPPFAPPKPPLPGRSSLPAPPAELRVLFSGTEQERSEALAKILQDGPLPPEVLARLLDDESPLMRIGSLLAFDSKSQATPATIEKLRKRLDKSDSPLERILTARAIVQSSGTLAQATNDDAFAVLSTSLQSSEETQANEAAKSLGAIGGPATPSLMKALQSDDEGVRSLAVDTLRQIGTPASDASAALLRLIETDASPAVQALAARAVAAVTVDPVTTSQSLVTLLSNAAPETAVAITDALAQLGAPAVNSLIQSLSDPQTRYWSVLALSEIGTVAASAEVPLCNLLDAASVDVATEILIALPKIGATKPETAAKVAKLVTKGDRDLSYAATFAIAKMGIQSDAAESALQSNMESDDLFLKALSAWAIAKTNPRAPAKVIATMKAIADLAAANDPRVREISQLILTDLKSTRGQPQP